MCNVVYDEQESRGNKPGYTVGGEQAGYGPSPTPLTLTAPPTSPLTRHHTCRLRLSQPPPPLPPSSSSSTNSPPFSPLPPQNSYNAFGSTLHYGNIESKGDETILLDGWRNAHAVTTHPDDKDFTTDFNVFGLYW